MCGNTVKVPSHARTRPAMYDAWYLHAWHLEAGCDLTRGTIQ